LKRLLSQLKPTLLFHTAEKNPGTKLILVAGYLAQS
jgi:hypothetical protein